MTTVPDKTDYVRYALYTAGINATDEQVEQIYATGYPYQAVDALVAAYHTYREDIAEQTRKLYTDAYRLTPDEIGPLQESNRPYAESQYELWKSRFIRESSSQPGQQQGGNT